MQGVGEIWRWPALQPLRGKRAGRELTMETTGNNIRKSLAKREEALLRFKALRASFLLSRARILRDIEEAQAIWEITLKQLPKRGFDL
jgi:hypothetical protein